MHKRTIIRSYYIDTLPDEYFKEAYRANFGATGYLRASLMNLRYALRFKKHIPIKTHRIYVALKGGEFAGWGLTEAHNEENTQFIFQCFVKRKFRKQGIGTKLLTANGNFIKKYEQRVICQVYPHSNQASALYKNNNLLFVDDIIPANKLKRSYQFV